MKHIGFLSFGHWTPSPQSQTRSASDALLQSIELAVAAEALGAVYAPWPHLLPAAFKDFTDPQLIHVRNALTQR